MTTVPGPRRLLYPVDRTARLLDRAVARTGRLGPMRCPVCGRFSVASSFGENLRETGTCSRCGAHNRHRQLARIACGSAEALDGTAVRSLADLARHTDLAVYNTEARGPIHELLQRMPGYVASEYFGPSRVPGELVEGVRHEDLMSLSFEDARFHLVLSSDVLEHIPDPYRAHREIHRVLRRGGRHVFTVPFHQHAFRDDVRAVPRPDGSPQLLAEPIYHDDPLSPEGALVYTIFSLEMLVHLDEIGFETRFYRLWEPWFGILGSNALVFEAIKRP